MTQSLTFLYPGNLATPTGGFAYDRRLIAALEMEGVQVNALSLGEGYPQPDRGALQRADETFAAIEDRATVVIDGLAYGVLEEPAARHAGRLTLIALVHHPLARETGIDAATAAKFKASETNALKAARAVIVTSSTTAATLAQEFAVPEAKITVIEPGLDQTAPAIGRENGACGIISVGSLVPRKDYPTLLAALAALKHLNWHLDIAGDDTRDKACTAEVAETIAALGLGDRVTLHGALQPSDLDRLYHRADIFALTTRYEGYGMAFTEAMARGLPVVATGEGAVAATVPPQAGFVLAGGDSRSVSHALERLMSDRDLKTKMSEAARLHAQSLPDWQSRARILIKIMEGLA